MDTSDQNKFKETLLAVTSTYDKEFNDAQVKIWWSLFKPYSADEFNDAVQKHFLDPNEGMFMPKPANIIKHIKADEVPVEALAEMAWSEVAAKISSIGSYGNLQMEDKQALATVRALGGWKCICGKTIEQLVWTKKEFISIYENYENTPVEMLPFELPGRIELEQHKSSKSLASNIINKLALKGKLK